MKAIKVIKPDNVIIVDVPLAKISNEHEVLIKVMAAGICGSDIAIARGLSPVATYPRIMGHEITGIVTETGNAVTRLKVGDHVIVKQTESCGRCYACLHGRENVCEHLRVRGVNTDGGYREYLNVPETSAYKISDSLDFITSVMIEPYTIAFHACTRGRLVSDDILLVYGAGALGSSIIDVAKSFCCKILAVDIIKEKLNQALNNGADYVLDGKCSDIREQILAKTNGYGPTICIDTVCNPSSVEFLLDIVGNAGRVITMGFDTRPSEIQQFKITSKEIDVIGSRLQHNNFENVIKLFENGKIDPQKMISHVFKFLDIDKAFDIIKAGNYRKIVLDFS